MQQNIDRELRYNLIFDKYSINGLVLDETQKNVYGHDFFILGQVTYINRSNWVDSQFNFLIFTSWM